MFSLTTVVNVLAMVVSLWLGFYVVTRSAHSRISWLAALTIWSAACLFLYNVLAINVPESGILAWIRPVVVLALPLLFHLTCLLSPDNERRGSLRLSPRLIPLSIVVGYGAALALIAGGAIPRNPISDAQIGTSAYISGRASSPLYFLVIALVFVLGLLSLYNLWRGRSNSRDNAVKQQFTQFLGATVLAYLAGLYISLGVWLRSDVPTLPGDVFLGAGVILLGSTIARYNALIEVRTIKRDFFYAALAVALLALSYYLAALVLYNMGHISFLSLMLVIVMATSSHALYDGIRVALDRLFFHEQFRQLRANLRALAREAGTRQPLSENLQSLLRSLCRALRIRNGFIALRNEGGFEIRAVRGFRPERQHVPLPDLSTTEIEDLSLSDSRSAGKMRLLVPLSAHESQIGALVLGPKENDQPYNADDLELLEDLADQIANVIRTAQLQEKNARNISQMVAEFRARERDLQRQVQQITDERKAKPILDGVSEKAFAALVEDGMRRLYDYPYLGEHALAQLNVVSRVVENRSEEFVTHLDRGKALNEVLLRALHKLRPGGTEPSLQQVPTREWHQFIILHGAYVRGQPNRDIMSWLYIGEGTFNRARRRAIRGVARALMEMERGALQPTS